MILQLIRYGTLALALAGFYGITVVASTQAEKNTPAPVDPPIPPPEKPFAESVAATGLLEALSENVAIGAPTPGLVSEVLVAVNGAVKKDQPLFRIDDRDLKAEEITRKADVEVARAQLAVAEAQHERVNIQLKRLTTLKDTGAVSQENLDTRRSDVAVAGAQIVAAKAQLTAAEAAVARLALLLERMTVKAPRDGTVLQVNVRAGEYAATSPKNPLMVIGDLDRLQVRADIDEQNATRIRHGQRARANLKGDPKSSFPLEFVRIEPYVIPKVSLTGASTERVDTRVLQVIFTFRRPEQAPPLYVGQQVDVFIEAPEP